MNLCETLTFKAAIFAKLKHANQKDDDGKDYFESHIMQVHKNG